LLWEQTNRLVKKLEDIEGVIRSRKSKKDRQCNGQKEKKKSTTIIYATLQQQ